MPHGARRHWTKSKAVGWLLNTQLCPVIWALILGLEAILVYKVAHAPLHTQCLPSTYNVPGQVAMVKRGFWQGLSYCRFDRGRQ